jgi:hypothetical protein
MQQSSEDEFTDSSISSSQLLSESSVNLLFPSAPEGEDCYSFGTFPRLEHESSDLLSVSAFMAAMRLEVPPTWPSSSRPESRSSHTDDGSYNDDNVSSIGESTWDLMEDRSGGSDDGSNLSRIPTTSSADGLEVVQDGLVVRERSRAPGTETDDKSHVSIHELATFQHHNGVSEAAGSSVSPEVSTTARTIDGQWPHNYLNQRRSEPFRFAEPEGDQPYFHVSETIKTFSQKEYERYWAKLHLRESPSPEAPAGLAVGKVRMTLDNEDTLLHSPYKIVYCGPREMKAPIVEKIGSALASTLQSSYDADASSLDSSRVTVVPISAWGSNSSPEVVLVESMGLDMSIDECTGARDDLVPKDLAADYMIEIVLNDTRKVKSWWNNDTETFEHTPGYELPDLAVFFEAAPSTVSDAENLAAFIAKRFMMSHNIPVLIIAYEHSWRDVRMINGTTTAVPHLSIEAVLDSGEKDMILCKIPINLSRFLDLDAGQLSRSLASLQRLKNNKRSREAITGTYTVDNEPAGNSNSKKPIAELSQEEIFQQWLRTFNRRRFLYFLLFTMVCTTGMRYIGPYLYTPDLATTTMVGVPNVQTTLNVSHKTTEIVLVSSTTSRPNTGLATAMPEILQGRNRSETFEVRVVGDRHVIFRPPQWLLQMKKAPRLQFKATRGAKILHHETSTLFEGVYIMELPVEEAYGALEVSIRSVGKPKIQGSFKVDFGKPWLKVINWQKGAQAMTETIRSDILSAQKGLWKAYKQTGDSAQGMLQDAVSRANAMLKEVENASVISILASANTTERILAASNRFSRVLSQSLLGSSKKAEAYVSRQVNTQREVGRFAKRVSILLAEQSRQLARAATGVDVLAVRNDIQEYRERHLRNSQKQALKLWWKVRGVPVQNTVKQEKANGQKGNCR